MNLEALATTLAADPDYRVLRRLKLSQQLASPPDLNTPLLKGVVIDTETTGLNALTDKIIEIGLVVFEYDPTTGQPIRVLDSYGGLEDPGHPLSHATTEITGITDDMLINQRIDDERVQSMVADANIVIAHNAAFDRPFLEKRLPIFSDLPWGCSLTDIPWPTEKFGSRKLDYIAFQMGFFFDAHRALEDSQALLAILAHPLPISEHAGLKPIITRLHEPSYTLYAIDAPFAVKDLLKARQYRWDVAGKVWYTTLDGDQAFAAETAWLKETIYAGRHASINIETRDACARFSTRPINRQAFTL